MKNREKEETSRSKDYVAGDAEKERLGEHVFDERKSLEDPLSGYALSKEVTDYAKIIVKTTVDKATEQWPCISDEKESTLDKGKLLLNRTYLCECTYFFSFFFSIYKLIFITSFIYSDNLFVCSYLVFYISVTHLFQNISSIYLIITHLIDQYSH